MKTAFILTTLMSAGLALSACAPTETPAAGAAPSAQPGAASQPLLPTRVLPGEAFARAGS